MGLTGLALSGFVFMHMTGNMLIFKSEEAYNLYGHQITHNPIYPLLSYGLIAIFLVHIFFGFWLTKDNKSARGSQYAMPTNGEKAASIPSKTMIYTGTLIAAFVILHLINFKYGTVYSVTYNGVEVRDLARLMVELFKQPGYVFWYIISLVLLGMHLRHGFYACFQSIGFSHPKYTPMLNCLAALYAAVVALGFISQPIYVFLLK